MKKNVLPVVMILALVMSTLSGCSVKERENTTVTVNEETNEETVHADEETIHTDEETAHANEEPVYANEIESLTDEQKKSIAMLNYLAVLTQEINESKNSRLFLENAYSSLIGNTHPNAVDYRTQKHLTELLDVLESYRMATIKRDRLEYLYEQNQAKAIKSAIPNPLGLLSAIQSANPIQLVSAVVYMAVDSATSYMAASEEAAQEYLQSGWALDDEEANVLHESRKQAFEYMLDIVREFDLPGDMALSEDIVSKYVSWKNQSNTVQKIQFFEDNKDTYQGYGDYWLTLASCYYENGDYEKCIESVKTYQGMNARIFRKDHDLARTLPLVIAAADEIQKNNEYVSDIEQWLQLLMNNTSEEDWALRYFAAQTYQELYSKTNSVDYLQEAYDITLNNVNFLVNKQREKNTEYLTAIQEKAVPEGKTDSEKEEAKEIKQYNQMLKEERETALPPTYEPFLLNCDFLFSLTKDENLGISPKELKKINDILHPSGEPVFLTDVLDASYWINVDGEDFSYGSDLQHQEYQVDFDGDKLMIPAFLVTDEAEISVTISSEEDPITDWVLEKVTRSNEGDVSTFISTYKSEEAKEHKYTVEDKVQVEIVPMKGMSSEKYHFNFEVSDSFKSVIPIPPFNLLDKVKFQVVP